MAVSLMTRDTDYLYLSSLSLNEVDHSLTHQYDLSFVAIANLVCYLNTNPGVHNLTGEGSAGEGGWLRR